MQTIGKVHPVPDEVIDAIANTLRKLEFGQIVIKVQDGRVVQIDSIERKRIGAFKTRHEDIDYHI